MMKNLKILSFLFVMVVLLAGCSARITVPRPIVQTEQDSGKRISAGYCRTTEAVQMFEKPDPGSRKLDRIDAGAIVQVVDIRGAFAQIKYSENAGWIPAKDVEETDVRGVVRTIGRTRVRESADYYSTEIDMLDSGRLLTLVKRSGDWLFVRISDNRGWVYTSSLEPLGLTESIPPQPRASAVYWKTYKKANLRSSPAMVSEILRVMPSGSTVRYIATEGDWVKVEYDGSIGWVHSDLVGPN